MNSDAGDFADELDDQQTRGAQPDLRFDLHLWHALAALAAVSLLAAMLSDSTFGWVLIALAAGAGSWYVRQREIGWTPDIREVLVQHRLAAPVPGARQPAEPNIADLEPPIPFRAMTIAELFSGAWKVVSKNWPTLVGIPAAILLVFLAIVFVSIFAIGMFAFGASASLSDSTLVSSDKPFSSLLLLFLAWLLLIMAIALPADALLLALSVVASERAVRGLPVGLLDVWNTARSRMFAVCRMTLTFYGLSALPSLVFVALLSQGGGLGSLVLVPFVSLGVFAASILFSLSPVVLVVESRGVVDSLRRSVSLSKPAWGRLIGIHLLWSLCFVPLMLVTTIFGLNLLVYAVVIGIMIAGFRVLQLLIYTDLRIRAEQYDHELIAEWARNSGTNSL